MQETQNFSSYKTRFSQYTLGNLIDGSPRVDEPYRAVITDAYNKLNAYFSDETYRGTLNVTKKNNIEGQVNNILSQFDTITAHYSLGSQQPVPNLEGISNNIQSYLEDFDMRFYTPYQTYLLQTGGDVAETINKVRKDQLEVENLKIQAQHKLEEAGLVVGEGASRELADHYQLLANGLTVRQNDDRFTPTAAPRHKELLLGGLALGVLVLLGADEITQTTRLLVTSGTDVRIRAIGVAIAVIALLVKPARKVFKMWRPGGYDRAATLWFFGALASVAATGVYAGFLLHELGPNPHLEELVPKLVSLLAPAYLVRFCVQNYRANKHLYVLNTHKATVARVAKGFSDQISGVSEALQKEQLIAQATILQQAAIVVFDPGESGYLTTKEGAGGGDSIFAGTPLDGKALK